MTQPIDEEAERLLAIEEAAAQAATAPIRRVVSQLLVKLNALWPGDDASEAQKALALSRLNIEGVALRLNFSDMVEALAEHITTAQEAGIEGALVAAAAGNSLVDDAFKRSSTSEAQRAARSLPEIVREQARMAAALIKDTPSTLAQAEEAVAVFAHAANRAEGVARWATNKAANEGVQDVVDQREELVSVWQPERDACVHCLAYAGQINDGNGYPKGLTYGKKPLHNRKVKAPPLHPNCRCRQVVWSPTWRSMDVALPEALRREAQRSILRGWSVQSESSSVRLDAAQRLLSGGTNLPKSVQDYAKRAIKRGEFPNGREFPQ